MKNKSAIELALEENEKLKQRISYIPELTEKAAERFIDIANINLKNKGTVDFTKEVSIANDILKKSN